MLRDATLAELNAEFGPPPGSTESRAAITCLDAIRPEPLRWLWPGRFPLGKLSILSGDPGLGKSLVTLALAAAVSRGAPWPCREGNAPLGAVVLISAEDDAADTIRPRLEAAGADLKRIHVLEGVDQPTESGGILRRSWHFGELAALDSLLTDKPDCRLVIVDPISAYLAGTDSHKNADVRALLAPLVNLAAEHGMALLAVSHLNKSAGPAMYRTTGSLAFVAAARAAYAVARDKENPARRLVLPLKCNLSTDSTGLAYRISLGDNGAPVIQWEPEPVTVSADEALAVMREDEGERGERQEAADWLTDFLANGPKSAKEIQAAAREYGLAWRTVRRAQTALGIRPAKTRFDGGWEWALPSKMATTPQDVHQKDVDTFGQVGHLRQVEGTL